MPEPAPDERPVSAHGAWYVNGTYVTGVMHGVTGYDPASGAVRWTVPLTGDLCAASSTATSSGQIAVSYTADTGSKSPKGVLVRYEAIDTALAAVAGQALELGASVHMPRIGCGLAGGKWSRIEPLTAARLTARGIDVTVYDHD
ncbi:hypothetical protein [Streptomyces sp. NRRL S-118]|uniref:hypothetical protein n=1 Tax=Streptomyces sp. NRRL S-118 TaxID=1463881 RepID=UPI000AD22420|nr:hypothetical protein [Streptomyces sp. NRRL S-118]